MGKRTRLVVAGAGAFGRQHLARLGKMDDVAIVGIADVDLNAARAAADRLGGVAVAADAAELVAAQRPDGLVVATPGRTHLPIALAALALDIPVLVEKPVGMDASEARALASAEASSRAFVLPGHILRFSEQHRRLWEIARSPAIGPILAFHSRRHRDDSHARRYPDVDPVLMTMIHDIDLGLWLTDGTIGEVRALRRPAGSRRSITMMTGMRADGAIWQLANAWTFPGTATPPDRIEIIGENGSVELLVDHAIRRFGAEPGTIDLRSGPAEDALAEELRHFVACIRESGKPVVVNMEDAVAGLSIADAVLASLASERAEPVR